MESNKLIAEFMGASVLSKEDFFEPDKIHTVYKFNGHPGNWRVDIKTQSEFTAPMLCYHTDWSWLMPVVEKIEDIEQIGCQCYINISAFDICFYSSGHQERGLNEISYHLSGQKFSGEDKIKAVYDCVIQFINWYNQQPNH